MPKSKPSVIYYRWVYSPSTGDVTLSHNHEGHPTDIAFHDDMDKERPERDLVHGYAHKQDAGWKVLTDEGKEIDDPHIWHSVNEEIKDYES